MKRLKRIGITTLAVAMVCASGMVLNSPTSTAHPIAGNKRLADRIVNGEISIRLGVVATGLTAPNWGTHSPVPGDDRLFVTDQIGILWAIDLTTGEKTVFLDVSDRLVDLGIAGPGTFDERGLLGIAFHPDYATNGLIYTYSSEPAGSRIADFPVPEGAPADHHSVIAEWHVPDPILSASVVDPSSRRELLRIGQPQFAHDGGALNFGPADGMLYISLGDGGGHNDDVFSVEPDGHTDGGNGQDATNVLGTILRIDPMGSNSNNGEYGIPSENPFVDRDGADEIYVYGFRNPYRFSIDTDGTLYVGDAGENDIEEIDRVSFDNAGGNYGWNVKEGTFCFDVEEDGTGFAVDPQGVPCPGDDGTLIDPIAEYDTHIEGHSVIGGFVYRGAAIPALYGRYVFGDFSRVFVGFIARSSPGRLLYLTENEVIAEFRDGRLTGVVLGMGQDKAGELYVLGNKTGIPAGNGGTVHRIVAGPTWP